MTDIKKIYNQRYNEMKSEFQAAQGEQYKNSAVLKCFSAYLWIRGEHEVLKKLLLSEVYK